MNLIRKIITNNKLIKYSITVKERFDSPSVIFDTYLDSLDAFEEDAEFLVNRNIVALSILKSIDQSATILRLILVRKRRRKC